MPSRRTSLFAALITVIKAVGERDASAPARDGRGYDAPAADMIAKAFARRLFGVYQTVLRIPVRLNA